MSTLPHPSSVVSAPPLERAPAAGFVVPRRAGITLAVLLGGTHLGWSFLVAVGWAQPLLDFLYRVNFVKPVDEVLPFNAGTALMLVFVTSAIGFALGWALAAVWNRLGTAKP
jgi:hypothetical protein